MDKIIREFKVLRGERTVIYPFSSFSCVLDAPPTNNRLREKMFTYLRSVFLSGVPCIDGLASVSEMSSIMVEVQQRKSELCELAERSDYRNRWKFQHTFVQNFMMDNDPYTIAIEVPVFDDEKSGHIDLIRLFENKIQVCDFKPEAHKEKRAASQVKRYMIMLGRVLRLPLSCFEGVYFDDKHAYFLI